MAFEVFDDVAFYWFFQVLLGIFLVPFTIHKIRNVCFGRKKRKVRTHPIVKNIPDYIPVQKLVEDEIDSRFSLTNIFFAALWVTFILMLIQLPKWHNRQMTNFEPYEILEIATGATMLQIKKQFRKLSLKYHPDRVRGTASEKAKAHDKFIMINKAYQALTDDKVRESYEKYGNPDGYQGMMVTVGLPSFLTHKENELAILTVYFLVLVLLVVLAWFWWKRTNKFHKSGVYKESIDIYWRYIKQNMNHKKLVDILCASSEYRIMDVKIPNDPTHAKMKAINSLNDALSGRRQKMKAKQEKDNIFEASYVEKATTLISAHLRGLPVPDELKDEYLFVLQEAPRLLDVMIDMTLSRERFWAQGLQLIQVKQAIVQGIWPFESRLKQLPHWTEGVNKELALKTHDDLLKLNVLNPKELKETLEEAYSKGSGDMSHLLSAKTSTDMPLPGRLVSDQEITQNVQHALAMVRMYPFVTMRYCARTYDEKDVFEGDIVTVTVELTRWHEPWKFDMKKHQMVEEMEPPERSHTKEEDEYDDEHGLDFVDANIDEKKRLQILRLNAPVVHVNRFPFRVREKWMVMLLDKQVPAVVDQCAIPALTSMSKVDLRFRMNRKAGLYKYSLVAKCDSYLGADKSAEFAISVKPIEKKPDTEEKEVDYAIPEEPEIEVDTKWYYLWNENVWECLLTIFLLYFIYLILVSTSWGKKYIQPGADWVYDNAIYPVAAIIATGIAPVVNPVVETVHDYTGFDVNAWWWGEEETDEDEDEDTSYEGKEDDYEEKEQQSHDET